MGANTSTLTVNDGTGNTATSTTNVIMADLIPPTMTCQNASLNLDANGQATLTAATVNNGSFDNCTIATFALGQTLYTCANLGTSSVVLTGTDQSGNSSTCSATVTVRDLIAPVARCKNFTANLGPNGNVTVAPASVDNLSTDNCSFTLSLTPNTFTFSNVGNNTVTLRATDGSGNNSATCVSVVTVTPHNIADDKPLQQGSPLTGSWPQKAVRQKIQGILHCCCTRTQAPGMCSCNFSCPPGRNTCFGYSMEAGGRITAWRRWAIKGRTKSCFGQLVCRNVCRYWT